MRVWLSSRGSAVHMWSLSRGIPVHVWWLSRRGTECGRRRHAGAQVPCGHCLVGAWGLRCHRHVGALHPCFRPHAQVLWTCRRRAEVLRKPCVTTMMWAVCLHCHRRTRAQVVVASVVEWPRGRRGVGAMCTRRWCSRPVLLSPYCACMDVIVQGL